MKENQKARVNNICVPTILHIKFIVPFSFFHFPLDESFLFPQPWMVLFYFFKIFKK
jgi:hypothetical protein